MVRCPQFTALIALGGVVNIITKDAKTDKFEFDEGNGYYESVGTANFDGAMQLNLFGDQNFAISGGRTFSEDIQS